MKRASSTHGTDLSQLLKIGLLAGGSLLAAAVFLFTNSMVHQLSRQVASTSRVVARFCAQASLPATTNPELRRVLSDLIAGVDFPMVVTDERGRPRAWRHVGVDPAMVPAESIDSLAAGLPVAPVIQERIDKVSQRVIELDRKNPPINMTYTDFPAKLGAVHYGEPDVLRRLQWMPYVTIAGFGLLLLFGLGGLAVIRQAEKRSIWVGMAKETAHQLGTPLSSLMGWIELLRGRLEGVPAESEVRVPAVELAETVNEMERDVDRLNRVAQRFSNVGSEPQLVLQDLAPVVHDVVEYMRKRTPHGSQVTIEERCQPCPEVRFNSELMAWALENLITNSLSALDKRPALIEVTLGVDRDRHTVELIVKDNGRGMAPREQRRAFDPGYSTKRRGWGLGLALARRVVEEYHGGRIVIRQSAPGEGTMMVISLPV